MSTTTIAGSLDNPAPSKWLRTGASLAAVLAAGTALCSVATQYVAYRLDYHPALGTPFVDHAYMPWSWVQWAQQPWAADCQPLFAQVYAGIGFAAVGSFVLALLKSGGNRAPRRYDTLHGTARFATPNDIRKSGFKDQAQGVYIGGWTDPKGILRYLRHNGAEHVAAIAPTRSGKGVGLVLPTLLSWHASTVVYDEKGELYQLTSGWRTKEAGNIVFRWQPGSQTDSCRFNFLDAVRIGTPHEVADAQSISIMLCDPDGTGLKTHWDKTSYALITGVILHECYKARTEHRVASLPDVAAHFSDPDHPADYLYEEMVCNEHLGSNTSHKFIAEEGRAQLNRDGKERASVHSSAVTAMVLFRDPIVCDNSRVSDFHAADLMNHDKPVSLYICVPGPDKSRLRPLVRLMLNTIIAGLTGVPIRYNRLGRPIKPHKRDMLLMLDEFPQLGRLQLLESSMAVIAGYGIKCYLIMQDRLQLLAVYTQNETILSNCHIQIAYAPNQVETAKWIASILGSYTVNLEDFSESGKRMGGMSNVSHSIRQARMDLMTPEQVMSMPGPVKVGNDIVSSGKMVIWVAGMKARIYGDQILYFNDPEFLRRSCIEPPATKASIRNPTAQVFTLAPRTNAAQAVQS